MNNVQYHTFNIHLSLTIGMLQRLYHENFKLETSHGIHETEFICIRFSQFIDRLMQDFMTDGPVKDTLMQKCDGFATSVNTSISLTDDLVSDWLNGLTEEQKVSRHVVDVDSNFQQRLFELLDRVLIKTNDSASMCRRYDVNPLHKRQYKIQSKVGACHSIDSGATMPDLVKLREFALKEMVDFYGGSQLVELRATALFSVVQLRNT